MALNVLLFGRKITPIPVSLISFRLRNFQLILGFEKRTGKRAILKKERKKEREEMDVKILNVTRLFKG